MKRVKETLLRGVEKAAYNQAVRQANKACPYIHNQPELPKKVDELRKLKDYDK